MTPLQILNLLVLFGAFLTFAGWQFYGPKWFVWRVWPINRLEVSQKRKRTPHWLVFVLGAYALINLALSS